MKTALFIGRFQPFHLGHLSAIRQALAQANLLYIGIGSAAESHQPDNPFTTAERITMIEKALSAEKIPLERFRIIPVPNIDDFPAWPAHVHTFIPPFEAVFTNSEIVRELFEKYDQVKVLPIKKEVPISATEIRAAMLNGGDWKKYLHPTTIALLERIGDRIQKTQPHP